MQELDMDTLLFFDAGGRMAARQEEGNLRFPTPEEAEAEGARYLFSLDGTGWFLARQEEAAPAEGEAGDDLTEIADEEVPLADAPKTGDSSLILAAISALSGLGYAGLNFTTRRKED